MLVINGGDVIQFVQDYFNLGFRDAIKKINEDFYLNINLNKLSKEKLREFREKNKIEKELKEKKQKKYRIKMLDLCNTSRILEKARNDIKSQLTPYNWEEIEDVCSVLTQQIEMLDYEFDKLNVKNY